MSIINDTKIKIETLKEALAIIKRYSDKDFAIAVLEGKIEGCETFLKDMEEINGKRNIL